MSNYVKIKKYLSSESIVVLKGNHFHRKGILRQETLKYTFLEYTKENNGIFIHPYDDEDVFFGSINDNARNNFIIRNGS